ncbi:hypothetical protein BDN72DRAFT_383750 [Pluteus cervinus]|uniref:Uncharacterized protein n=1 Tax=Pluteus cervinus TaxID=181527 RepID=A0ACD3AAB5_9AGAR|nr:hypothetical protein BDN72DRAFT_383750 [Pluteus cervinus]
MSRQTLPPGIITRLLRCLDGRTLLECRQVCCLWSKIIADDTDLQYTVELYNSGMMDQTQLFPDLSTAERLDKLRIFLAERRNRTQLGERDAMVGSTQGSCNQYQSYSIARLLGDGGVLSIVD